MARGAVRVGQLLDIRAAGRTPEHGLHWLDRWLHADAGGANSSCCPSTSHPSGPLQHGQPVPPVRRIWPRHPEVCVVH